MGRLNYKSERHQISCEQYWGFARPPHQILAQSVNIEQSYGLSKSRYTPKNEKNDLFLVADTRLYTLPCRLVGPFLNSGRFLHYCSCPTFRDCIAVYPALFFI